MSCENEFDLFRHASNLGNIEASIRFISFEPLLRWRGLDKLVEVLKDVARVQWVIIGGVTKHPELPQPQISWVKDIVTACDHAGVKVFLKNSLYWLLEDTIPNPLFWKRDVISNILRQEMPESKR